MQTHELARRIHAHEAEAAKISAKLEDVAQELPGPFRPRVRRLRLDLDMLREELAELGKAAQAGT